MPLLSTAALLHLSTPTQPLPDALRGEKWAFVQLPLSTLREMLQPVGTVSGMDCRHGWLAPAPPPPGGGWGGGGGGWRLEVGRQCGSRGRTFEDIGALGCCMCARGGGGASEWYGVREFGVQKSGDVALEVVCHDLMNTSSEEWQTCLVGA